MDRSQGVPPCGKRRVVPQGAHRGAFAHDVLRPRRRRLPFRARADRPRRGGAAVRSGGVHRGADRRRVPHCDRPHDRGLRSLAAAGGRRRARGAGGRLAARRGAARCGGRSQSGRRGRSARQLRRSQMPCRAERHHLEVGVPPHTDGRYSEPTRLHGAQTHARRAESLSCGRGIRRTLRDVLRRGLSHGVRRLLCRGRSDPDVSQVVARPDLEPLEGLR